MKTIKKILLWVVILVAAIIIIVSFVKNVYPKLSKLGAGDYQAVFLDGGQTYFGRLSKTSANFLYLKDVFYIQSSGATPVLVELGTVEPHGPKNYLRINRDKVILIQDLKADSQVVKAIQDYRAKQGK